MPSARHFLPVWVFAPLALLAAIDALARGAERFVLAGLALGVIIVGPTAVTLARIDARYSRWDFGTHGGSIRWTRLKTVAAWADALSCLRRVVPPHVDPMGVAAHGMLAQVYPVLDDASEPISDTWYIGRDIGIVGWLAPVRVFDTEGLFTPAVVASKAWRADHTVEPTLLENALARRVVATELLDDWTAAAHRSVVAHARFETSDDVHLVPRRHVHARPDVMVARYRRALSRLPSAYYVMTLYGEAMGAALDRRVAWIERMAIEARTPTVTNVPEHLAGEALLDDEIALLGCEVSPARAAPRAEVTLTCYFRPLVMPTRDYDVFVHVEDEHAQRVVLADHAPLGGFYPARSWRPSEIVRDVSVFRIPEGAAPTLAIRLGLFDGDHRAHASGTTDDRVVGPTITVPTR
jgi:hypothetical protein